MGKILVFLVIVGILGALIPDKNKVSAGSSSRNPYNAPRTAQADFLYLGDIDVVVIAKQTGRTYNAVRYCMGSKYNVNHADWVACSDWLYTLGFTKSEVRKGGDIFCYHGKKNRTVVYSSMCNSYFERNRHKLVNVAW